jgi:hypothetical protein
MQSDFVEKLPCELTREETLAKGAEMALMIKQHGEVELEAKETADTFKKQFKRLDRTISERAEEVRTGVEHRLVPCTERGRYRENMVDVVRLDTGEIVRSRPMTESEKQQALPFGAEHQITQ